MHTATLTPDTHEYDAHCETCTATTTEDDADEWVYDELRDELHCENCAATGPTPRPYDIAHYG